MRVRVYRVVEQWTIDTGRLDSKEACSEAHRLVSAGDVAPDEVVDTEFLTIPLVGSWDRTLTETLARWSQVDLGWLCVRLGIEFDVHDSSATCLSRILRAASTADASDVRAIVVARERARQRVREYRVQVLRIRARAIRLSLADLHALARRWGAAPDIEQISDLDEITGYLIAIVLEREDLVLDQLEQSVEEASR